MLFYVSVFILGVILTLAVKVPYSVDDVVLDYIYSVDIDEVEEEKKEKVFNVLLCETTHANFKGCPSAHDLTKQLLEGEK